MTQVVTLASYGALQGPSWWLGIPACSLDGLLGVMGLGETGGDSNSQGTPLWQVLGELGKRHLFLEAILETVGPKNRVFLTSKTSHKVEKPFLLKNLEGKSHNSKNTKVECKKTPCAAQCWPGGTEDAGQGRQLGRRVGGSGESAAQRSSATGAAIEVRRPEGKKRGRREGLSFLR